jgi:hypothetical protein
MNRGRFLAVVAIAVLSLAPSLSAAASSRPPTLAAPRKGACAAADPAAVLARSDHGLARASIRKASLRAVGGGKTRLRWLAVSWEGPPDGRVFVLDCDARTLAAKPLGYVQRIGKGPTVEGLPTLEAVYVSPGGDAAKTQVSLLQLKDGAVRVLWTHAATEAWGAPLALVPHQGPAGERWRSSKTVFTWRYLRHGAAISVAGLRNDETREGRRSAGATDQARTTSAEAFCYRAENGAFERCG